MHTVLVVEDEKLIRQGIATMIKRSGVPVERVLECANGLQAMDILRSEKVDVMFTDIRMPKMNGIELVQTMQELENPPLTIAVSGYDDFSYAVEMMRQGVREYILKPVERDKLREILEKLEKEISARAETDRKTDYAGKQLLKYLLMDDKASGEEIELHEKRLRSEIGNEYMVIVTSEGDPVTYDLTGSISLSDVDDANVYLTDRKKADELKNKYLGRAEDEECSYAGASDIYTEVKDLKAAYKQARTRRDICFCMNKGIFEDVDSIHIADKLADNGKKLCDKAAVSARTLLIGTDRIEALIREWKGFFTAVERGIITAGDFLIATDLFVNEYRNVYQREVPEVLKKPFAFASLSDYREEFIEFIEDANDRIIGMTDEDQVESKIRTAIKYIKDNYNKDLNMAVVSNEVSMNYSLFSSAFKNYTGTNFVNYVKELRMQEAKRLLAETDLKVNEISAKVGYDNEKHFMKSFKAVNMVSPTEYRKNISQGQRQEPS